MIEIRAKNSNRRPAKPSSPSPGGLVNPLHPWPPPVPPPGSGKKVWLKKLQNLRAM